MSIGSQTIRTATPIFWAVFLTVAIGLVAPGLPLVWWVRRDGGPLALVVAIVTAVPWLYLLGRAVAMRVVVSDAGLLVAGYLRTAFVGWDEIERLTTRLGSSAMQTGSGRVELAIARKGTPGWLLATATSTATEDLAELTRRLGVIETRARERGISFQWDGLDEQTQAQIRSRTPSP